MGRKKTRKRWFGWALVGVVVAIGIVPYLIAATPLRNVVVAMAVAPSSMRATVSGASFGWFSPLSVDGLRLTTSRGEPLAEVGRLTAEMPWWKLSLARPNLGHFQLDRPHVELIARDDGTIFRSVGQVEHAAEDQATLSVDFRNGSFLVRHVGMEQPIVQIDHLYFLLRIERARTGRVLTIDSFQPLNHQRLTRSMCHDGLQLIAPVLADAAQVDGEVSLRFDELRIPVNTVEGRRIRGRLQLHAVEAGLKDSWLTDIVRLVGLASKTDVPAMIRIADSADIHFYIKNHRVYHDGLVFGLPAMSPDLVIRTRGSVGFDESLDLTVDIPGLRRLVGARAGQQVSNTGRVEISVRGTLAQPEITLPDAAGYATEWLDGVLDANRPHGDDASAGPLVDEMLHSVRDLLQQLPPPEHGGGAIQRAIPLVQRLRVSRRQRATGRSRR